MLSKCKMLIVFILMLSSIANSSILVSAAQEENGFQYEIKNGEIEITGYSGSDTVLEIPDTLNGRPVTSIGEYAFDDKQLTSVTIPESVTSIGFSAFAWNKLTSVTIPKSVKSIGDHAFQTNQLTSVTIPDSVTYIGDFVFSGNKLTKVKIPESVTSIGIYAFASNKLTSVTIPESVTSIGSYAFAYNELTSVTIPDSITKIETSLFESNQLTSIKIPDSITSIGDCAFWGNQLVSVTIPKSVTTIGEEAFGGMEREGYIFDKWYVDQECTKVWDEASSGVTIYAKKKDVTENKPTISKPFTDVPATHTFYNDINYLVNKSIISGYPDGSFRPGKSVTRAEAAIMLGRALGLDGTQQNTSFSDVGSNSVASGYIQSTVEAGIIQGYPDGTYRPSAPVTRGQMAIFLARAFELTETTNVTFTDVSRNMVSYDYIGKILAANITFGYNDNTYRPNEACTRGQFSAFLTRALKYIEE